MKTIAIIALVSIAAAAFFAMSSGPSSDIEEGFRYFLDTYRVGYGNTDEYSYRLGVFADNLKIIERLNEENPEAFFTVNQFADRTPQEMEKMMGLIVPAGTKLTSDIKSTKPAPAVDWTNMWTSVKNQGSCGSCWAFSATGAFEGRKHLKDGKKSVETSYSEQQLVDCNKNGCYGCSGGWMHLSFDYLMKNGFCTSAQYPYTARDGACRYDALGCSAGPRNPSYKELPFGDEDAQLEELKNGPISVAVDAGTWSFYSGGVLSSCGKNINHGVTLVESNPSGNFAKIRNSWGGSWGEKGHIKIKLGSNMCNYAIKSSIPIF